MVKLIDILDYTYNKKAYFSGHFFINNYPIIKIFYTNSIFDSIIAKEL